MSGIRAISIPGTMATENQNPTTLANHFEKFRESMKELQSSMDEKLKQVMKKFDDLRASIPKHDRKVLICGYTEEEDCVCEVTNSLNSVYQDINDEDDVDLDFKEEESHQTQLQIQQNVGSIVLEIGGHEDFLAEIKDPSSLVNQVCTESIHDKVISVSYSDFSSPSLSTNTAVGTICANKKGILVADNMFDKSSERNGYSVELQPKPPDAYNSLNNLIMYGFNTTTELKTKESIYQCLVSVAANNQQPSQVVYKDDSNWFSPYTVHRLERRVVPHYFFGKLMNHTYMECWNCIAAKYMEIPDKRLAVFHCDGLAIGINIDDMTRIFYFLDYWGIINSYVAAQSLDLRENGLCFSKDSDGELRVSMTLLKSIDNLIQFDRLKCLLSAANVYPELGCRGHEVFNLDNRVQDRLSENSCDYCSRPLFIVYYQSQKKVDVLLSLDCFHEGRFVTGHLSLDFTRVDSGKDYEISKYTVEAPESVALIFPIDVVVPPGNTGLDPSQINFFQVLNISTKINKGTVEIITTVDLFKKGDKVGPFEAALLVRLGLRSISYGVIVQSAYDTDSLVSPEVLDLSVNDSVAKLANGVSNSASLTQVEQVKKYLKYPVKFDVAVYIIVLRCFGNPSKPHHSLLDNWQSKTEYLPKNLKFEDILHAIEGWSDKYVIGRGKHGTVYRTESVKSTKSWVVKRVDFFETNFSLKMRTVNLLGHRNIVKLAGYYIKDRYSFMVTEYKRKYALDQKELKGHIKWASISSNSLMLVISLLKLCAYMVKENSQFKDKFVTMGGVSLYLLFSYFRSLVCDKPTLEGKGVFEEQGM